MLINENPINIYVEDQGNVSKLLNSKKISIVIPMFNEEKSILSVLKKIPTLPNYEIIVVDDGSTDKSCQIVQDYDHIRIVKHEVNMGYGKTLLDGIMSATGDVIVTLDADGQHDPRDIYNMVSPILNDKADMVIGSRYLGKYYYPIPFTSRAGESFIQLMLRIFFQTNVRNNQNGFRAYRNTIKTTFRTIKFLGFDFATETLLKASIHKLRIKEVPIHLYGRRYGTSRIHLVKLLLGLCKCLLNYIILKYLGRTVQNQLNKTLKSLNL